MKSNFIVIIILSFPILVQAQFAPAAGKPGSTALRHDSSCFVNWAKQSSIQRGFMDISNPDSGYASVGDSGAAVGNAFQNGVVSLGDGGTAILSFPYPIKNGPGWDFAVFENSFLDTFLELAFVEVSSDGKRFVRFASESLTDTIVQTPGFGYTLPENIHNLAGKYRAGYGTPFDLNELKDSAGLDVQNIKFVRIVDVVGCVNSKYACRDSKGRKINDPWFTRFPSSGFDLDAVGVIHQNISVSLKKLQQIAPSVKPNPAKDFIEINAPKSGTLQVFSTTGQIVFSVELQSGNNLVSLNLPNGLYVCKIAEIRESFFIQIIH